MNPLYVCTLVFNRHDLLEMLFASIAGSTRRPDGVYVVDHAYDSSRIQAIQGALDGIPPKSYARDPGYRGREQLAAEECPDDSVGCGDDAFLPDALSCWPRRPAISSSRTRP